MKKIFHILLFIILQSYFSCETNAQNGWHWQNPLPQGNPLYSISFVSSCGWAVGPMGTAVHTRDYGETWERVDLGTTQNLNAVCMHDDLMTFIVGDNGLILFVMDHIDSLEISQQTSNTTANLNSVTSNINACPWVVGDDGTVLRSNDMGQTWVKQNVIFNYNLNMLHNIECTEAWAVGPDGFMMYTSNWGITWNYVPTPTSYYLFSVHVGTFENIRVTGQQGLIMHTDDKGVSWEIEHQENGYNLHDLINIGMNNAYAVGTDEKILETIDYGATWTKPVINPELYSTTFYDVEDHYGKNQVWVAGHYGVILKNSGVETAFELQNKGTLHWLHDVEFAGNHGWAVGGEIIDLSGHSKGIVLHTSDGGESWEEQYTLSSQLTDVDFINENEGWAIGRNGIIKHTVDGGNYWSTQSGPIGGNLTGVCFVDENNGWIVSRDNWGEIIHTTNGGTTWVKQVNPANNPLHGLFFINPNKGWAVGLDSTIIRTLDGGLNWERSVLNISNNYRFASVFFIDELKGWAVGTQGCILLTENGGTTWQEINTDESETLNSVFFIDHKNGWAVGDQGMILRSVNGGYNWFRQQSGVSTNFLASVYFNDTQNGWVVGEGGTIIHTSNGGFMQEPGKFQRNGLNLPINDLAETKDVLFIDLSAKKNSGYQLTGLEVMIDSIIHSRASDLEIYLSHNDLTVTLVDHVTDQGENFLWTKLTDEATMLITDGKASFSGNHKPVNPLAAFNGHDPDGEWTLTIYDSETGNTGTLNSWGIKPLYAPVATSVIEQNPIDAEQKVQLLQNMPNPFSEITQINWTSEISGHTVLKIFNIHGQEIATLVNKFMPVGENKIEFDASSLSPGVYYYQLKVGNYRLTKKCIVM